MSRGETVTLIPQHTKYDKRYIAFGDVRLSFCLSFCELTFGVSFAKKVFEILNYPNHLFIC